MQRHTAMTPPPGSTQLSFSIATRKKMNDEVVLALRYLLIPIHSPGAAEAQTIRYKRQRNLLIIFISFAESKEL